MPIWVYGDDETSYADRTIAYHLEERLRGGNYYRPEDHPCPTCAWMCLCVHWEEVDNGVGVQVYDKEWECPYHGTFRFSDDGEAVMQNG